MIYQELEKKYRFSNPYKIAKRHYLELGEDPYTYGETPLETFEQIGKALGLHPSDTLLELGCGRGIGALYLHEVFHCRVIGIDIVPTFIHRAQQVVGQHRLRFVEFHCGDMLKVDFEGATKAFLAGTCLTDDVTARLTKKLKRHAMTIASISAPLPDLDVIQELEIKMPWGQTSAFIQKTF